MDWYIGVGCGLLVISFAILTVSGSRRRSELYEAYWRIVVERDDLRGQLAASQDLVQKLFAVKEVDRTRPCGAWFRTSTWGILRCRKPLGHNLDHRTISPAGDALQFNDYMVDRCI